jgi:hypothetical protein
MGDILVITEHLKGEFQDITFEMLGRAKEMAGISGGEMRSSHFWKYEWESR